VEKPDLGTVDVYTKFEVSVFTHCEDMKGDKNVELGWFRGLGVTQGHQQHNHSIERIQLPIRL